MKKFSAELINVYKDDEHFDEAITTHLTKLEELVNSFEKDYELITDKFELCIYHVNEALDLLCYYRKRIQNAKIPIKELLQYSDKLKIDKCNITNKLEMMKDVWKRKRPSFVVNTSVHEIDLNENRPTSDDTVLINEVYEEL